NAPHVHIHSGIDLEHSPAAEQALHQGIPLNLRVDSRIARYRRFWAWLVQERRWQWRISYLPLSRQYVLDYPNGDRTTYARLRHLRSALRVSRAFTLNYPQSDDPKARYQVQIRGYIDIQALPSPLRLPALFSPQWRLNSGWRTWLMDTA
ncbi:MAG TPA: DUF4390 domain-containing protein, partial [Kiloniellaceae bacterium]|nr:DUF4390 domain-containing protein [Kiloniellaceae bacterium]